MLLIVGNYLSIDCKTQIYPVTKGKKVNIYVKNDGLGG